MAGERRGNGSSCITRLAHGGKVALSFPMDEIGWARAMNGQLEIGVLGELRVARDGKPVPLPRSKETRALLAYLVVSGRPQRRERLCDLFWEVPDDPRGALR
jgi:hypothetical protein